MKKKVILAGLLLVLGLVGLSGCQYYQDTYKGEEYYAIVPEEVPAKEVTVDNQGKEVSGSYSYKYDITWANEDGETLDFPVEVSGDNPEPLTPGSYIKATISKKRIVEGPNTVEEGSIPQNALDKLK
ncbi:YxeA family protein [Enterococcus nangangensis]|uniref:YxeA family protein n=1 Tax=Enterococcus nangangensis TaxID=2559926 RepID=UPI0010FA56E9|nr:YxeA family protein [Enterococcus nangangensis]